MKSATRTVMTLPLASKEVHHCAHWSRHLTPAKRWLTRAAVVLSMSKEQEDTCYACTNGDYCLSVHSNGLLSPFWCLKCIIAYRKKQESFFLILFILFLFLSCSTILFCVQYYGFLKLLTLLLSVYLCLFAGVTY